MIVSWEPRLAVSAPFSLIAEHWSDFFYPSSDDALVTPHTVDWLLTWDHDERFEFGVTV